MAKKQTDTSVIATYKDKHTETFQTIEEASEKTGLSVNSIKSRANKPGSGAKSKDGMTFEWADPSVKRSKQAKKNKTKTFCNSCPHAASCTKIKHHNSSDCCE